MKFFGREEEIAELRRIRDIAARSARMTILTGRRRVGKTELVKRALADGKAPYLHLPITRQPEYTLCEQLQQEVESVLQIGIHGQCRRFGELFEEIMKESLTRTFTVVLDEFQEFDRTNPGVFGDIQAIWDKYHTTSKINLVISGSVNRLMNKIFYNDSEPLYGRNTGDLQLKPFKVSLLKKIFKYYCPAYKKEDLLVLWTLSGGVARYVEMMMSAGAFTRESMLDVVFALSSSYINEGKAILAEEFGPDYGTYFTILASIASGQTTTAELRNALGIEVGAYLAKLEDQYSIVSKKLPLLDRVTAKNSHYQIDDCFFRFWFRFVFKNRYLLEMGRLNRMRDVADRDLDAFSGFALERYFQWKFIEDTEYTRMGAWWDRKGENEIDLVCEDEQSEKMDFYEIKVDKTRFRREELERKVAAFFTKHPELKDYKNSIRCLSLEDM